MFEYVPEVLEGILTLVPRHLHYCNPRMLSDPAAMSMLAQEVQRSPNLLPHFWLQGVFGAEAPDLLSIADSLPPNAFVINPGDLTDLGNTEIMKLGIVLPSLERVPLTVVRQLRKDYGDIFVRFQRALELLSQHMAHLPPRRRLREILLSVEEATAKLHSDMKRLRTIHHSLAAFALTIPMVFVLKVSDPAVVAYLHAVFSGIGTSMFFSYFRERREIRDRLDRSPFLFPLRVTEGASQW